MKITYQKLAEKFIDKGHEAELHWLVLSPPICIQGRTVGTEEEQKNFHKKAVDIVYGEEWEYWNTWIDYQKHK